MIDAMDAAGERIATWAAACPSRAVLAFSASCAAVAFVLDVVAIALAWR